MLDKRIRTIIDPALNAIATRLSNIGIGANAVTWTGFALGALAAFCIGFEAYWAGLIFLLLSRLCDGLDGAVARIEGKTDLGGFLDIVLDFAFYGLIPLAFIFANPDDNGLAGGIVLLAFYINGASFLTYALMAEKRGLEEQERGKKSILYTSGLAEATETIFVFCLWCTFPQWFSSIAIIFSAIVAVTTISRFVAAYQNFKQTD